MSVKIVEAYPEFCPGCGIGLNYNEKRLSFCKNCKTVWSNDNFTTNKKTGRPKGTKNQPGHKAGAVKKEPTVRVSVPLSKLAMVRELIKELKIII